MNNENSIDQMLVVIAEMIELIQNHTGPISENITPKVLERLDKLEQEIAAVQEINHQMFQRNGIDHEHLQETIQENPNLTSREKNLLQRAKTIEYDAKSLQSALERAKERSINDKKSSKSKKEKQTMKERRKLFKPMGGDKNWIPL